MIDPRCWVISYHFVNRSCSLGAEPCVAADEYPDSLLVIYQDRLNEQCITWIPPLNDPGYRYFSKRLVETSPHHGRHYAVGRMVTGSDIRLGTVDFPSADRGLLVIVDRVRKEMEPTNYELLSVNPKCTLAWVPYKAGDAIHAGALKHGYMAGEGHSYSIRAYLADINTYVYGEYISGDCVGYHPYYGVSTLNEMYILAEI